MMTAWNSIPLISAVKENESKSVKDYLGILFKNLKPIQCKISPEFRTEQCLHDKIINDCNHIEACVYACLKPSASLERVCSDIHSSIIAFK